MRSFNTTGPVNPADHYCIPPLQRFDLDEVLMLVRMKKYFVLHAPRQTGKTSALLALRDLLHGQGYRCVYATVEDARTAREQLIVRRVTHLDQLADKLGEARVRRVVEPMLSGADEHAFSNRDVEYVRDLGLIAGDAPVRIANPIYAEVVPRELSRVAQETLDQDTAWYVGTAGGLDVGRLMSEFQGFFRRHSEHWRNRFEYEEAWPQLLLQAFLHRVVNGGGRIEREYGLGRGRVDLLLVWPRGGRSREWAVECKVVRDGDGLESTVAAGVEQTAGYMDRCAAEAGHLVIFDQRAGRSRGDKVFHRRRRSKSGAEIDVWGM